MSDKPMIVSVSTQLPPPLLSANEIMQEVQKMLEPIIAKNEYYRSETDDNLLDAFVQLKRDVWGSSDE
jgi:hypothetical protein